MKKFSTRDLVLTAVFIALGVILPYAFHVVPNAWTFLPMHIPTLIAGLLLGPISGFFTGILSVVLNTLITSMPGMDKWLVMIPELAAYGFFAGLFQRIFSKDYFGTIISLLLAMIAGRVVYGIMSFINFYVISGAKPFSIKAFIAGAFVKVFVGIIIQIIIVPIIVLFLRNLMDSRN